MRKLIAPDGSRKQEDYHFEERLAYTYSEFQATLGYEEDTALKRNQIAATEKTLRIKDFLGHGAKCFIQIPNKHKNWLVDLKGGIMELGKLLQSSRNNAQS